MAALEFYLYNVIVMMFHCKHTVFRPDQFDFSFHGPDRPKILGIKKKKKKKKEVWQCMAKLQPFVATACAYLNVLFSHYQAQNYCEAKYSWKETFGVGDLQAQPEECGVKGQYYLFIYLFIYFAYLPTHILEKLIRETRN